MNLSDLVKKCLFQLFESSGGIFFFFQFELDSCSSHTCTLEETEKATTRIIQLLSCLLFIDKFTKVSSRSNDL